MTAFRPALGTYDSDVVNAAFTILINSSSTANTAWTQPTWSSTFPIGTSGQTGSLGHSGIERILTGTYQINARDSFPRYFAVGLTLNPSGTTDRGYLAQERYDMRASASGSNGGNGTIVFEILSAGSPVDPAQACAVTVQIVAGTHSRGGPGTPPQTTNNTP